jgi:hypothetical protein
VGLPNKEVEASQPHLVAVEKVLMLMTGIPQQKKMDQHLTLIEDFQTISL